MILICFATDDSNNVVQRVATLHNIFFFNILIQFYGREGHESLSLMQMIA